jgi:hypothetical protein
MAGDPFFVVRDKHTEVEGLPRLFTNDDPNLYLGFFENLYGEQWVFVFKRDTKEGVLYGGDIGWEEPSPVVDGRAQIVLGKEEQMWLGACWQTCVRR